MILLNFDIVSLAKGVVGVKDFDDLSDNSIIQGVGGDFATSLRNIAVDVFQAIRIIVNGIALLALLYVGYLWITSMGGEEKQAEGRMRILLIVAGLFIVNVSELIYEVISGSDYLDDDFARKTGTISTRDPGGEISESTLSYCNYFFCPQTFWGTNSVIAIVKFLEMAMVATAVIMFTWGGFMLLFRGGDEEANTSAKRRLGYGVVALIVIGFIEGIYRAILFGSTLNATGIINILVTIANFALYLGGPIAIIYIIVGGYFYITAGGNEERADRGKRILLYTFFATILLILSYTLLIELVTLSL